MNTGWTVLVTLGGIVLLFEAGLLLHRWPRLISLVIAAYVLIAWEVPNPAPLVSISGSNIYLLDLTSIVLLVIALCAHRQGVKNLGSQMWLWYGFGALIMISLVRGILTFPLGQATNEFRSFFYPFAMITWGLTRVWDERRRKAIVYDLSFVLGWGLIVAGIVHIAVHGFGGATDYMVDPITGELQTLRPLVSGQALMLLMCAIVAIARGTLTHSRWWYFSGVVFAIVLVIVQQRTVWVAGAAAIAAVIMFGAWRARMKIATMVVAGVFLGAIFVLSGASTNLTELLSQSASNSGTYDARTLGWINLLSQGVNQGMVDVLFGQPFGFGFGRFEGAGGWVTFAPHNWYLTVFLRTGMLGLSMLGVFLACALVRRLRTAKQSPALLAIFSALMTYAWSYSWPWYVGTYLAWSVVGSDSGEASSLTSKDAPLGRENDGRKFAPLER